MFFRHGHVETWKFAGALIDYVDIWHMEYVCGYNWDYEYVQTKALNGWCYPSLGATGESCHLQVKG